MASDLTGVAEVLKVLVISADTNRMIGTQEQGAATFEAKDDCSELFIMSIIVPLRWQETSRVECDGMDTIFKFLCNNHS